MMKKKVHCNVYHHSNVGIEFWVPAETQYPDCPLCELKDLRNEIVQIKDTLKDLEEMREWWSTSRDVQNALVDSDDGIVDEEE